MGKQANTNREIEKSNRELNDGMLREALSNIIEGNFKMKKLNDNSLEDLLELKRALHPINNAITFKLTEKFIELLPRLFPDKKKDIDKLLKHNKEVNVNANGFDFCYENIIAEVKANIPYEEEKYGSSQKEGIKKDIKGLLHGKEKVNLNEEQLSKYYKFLVILSYTREPYNSNKAIKNLIDTLEDKDKNKIGLLDIKEIGENPQLKMDCIYILEVGL